MVTYFVERMRVIRPTGKTRERNPERVYTVNGIFYATRTEPDGTITILDKLSIPSKNVDIEDVQSSEFSLDLAQGLLSLPEGKRGRTASQGLSEADILAELAYLRGESIEPEEAPEETPEPEPVKGKGK